MTDMVRPADPSSEGGELLSSDTIAGTKLSRPNLDPGAVADPRATWGTGADAAVRTTLRPTVTLDFTQPLHAATVSLRVPILVCGVGLVALAAALLAPVEPVNELTATEPVAPLVTPDESERTRDAQLRADAVAEANTVLGATLDAPTAAQLQTDLETNLADLRLLSLTVDAPGGATIITVVVEGAPDDEEAFAAALAGIDWAQRNGQAPTIEVGDGILTARIGQLDEAQSDVDTPEQPATDDEPSDEGTNTAPATDEQAGGFGPQQ